MEIDEETLTAMAELLSDYLSVDEVACKKDENGYFSAKNILEDRNLLEFTLGLIEKIVTDPVTSHMYKFKYTESGDILLRPSLITDEIQDPNADLLIRKPETFVTKMTTKFVNWYRCLESFIILITKLLFCLFILRMICGIFLTIMYTHH
jgi:hypothetical protein